MNKTALCTICSYNYLSFGINSCISVKEHNSNIDVFLLIVDKKIDAIELPFQNIIHYDFIDNLSINTDLLINMKFKYNVIEMNTAVKPFYLLNVMNYGYDNIIYLDPDIMCFNSLNFISKSLEKHTAIVTPHRFTTIKSDIIDDSVFLNNGLYNFGFFAVRNNTEGRKILSWWDKKLQNQAFLDYSKGLATDQIWGNFIPIFFDNVLICKNYGLNVAFWNLEERKISKINSVYYANEDVLLFYHFSNYSPAKPQKIMNYLNISSFPEVKELYDTYHAKIISYGYNCYSKIPYAYDYFDNGKMVTSFLRRLYSNIVNNYEPSISPFDTKNKDSFYYHFVKKNGRIRSYNKTDKKNSLINIVVKLIGIRFLQLLLNSFSKLSIERISRVYKNDKSD